MKLKSLSLHYKVWLANQNTTKAVWIDFFVKLLSLSAAACSIIWLIVYSPSGTIPMLMIGGFIYFVLFTIYLWASAYVAELQNKYRRDE